MKKQYFKFADFKRLLDDNPTLRNVELSDDGEIFLNPDLQAIIEYAGERKLNLTARNGVNLNDAPEEMLESLVKHRFKVLLVSIDAATNHTYQVYRRGGDLNKVISNIKKINFFKQKYHSKFPVLIWQFIVFGHNEHEMELCRRMAAQLGMRFLPIFNRWEEQYSPVRNKELVRRQMGYYSIQEYENQSGNLYRFPCHQLWLAPQIRPDGELIGCCVHNPRWPTFGNVFSSGLRACLKSEKYLYARQMLLGRKAPRDDVPCMHCVIFAKVREQKNGFLKLFINRMRCFFEPN